MSSDDTHEKSLPATGLSGRGRLLRSLLASRMRLRLHVPVLSRSECPCPKAITGPNGWDPNKHWMVRDIVIRSVNGVYVLAVRFKSIKQDRRIERPEARFVANSPPSRALTRLRASLLQQP